MMLCAKPGCRIVYMGEARLEKETQPGGIRLTVTGFDFNFGTVERVEQLDDGFAEADPTVLYHLKGGGIVRAELARVIGFNTEDMELILESLRRMAESRKGTAENCAIIDKCNDLAKRLKDFHYA